MSTSGVVIHCISMRLSTLNPQEIHCFDGNFVFDLRDVIQDRNHDVKQDLPALNILY